MKKKKRAEFEDLMVLYHSAEDKCWIAHSLRTDQIGTGNRIVDALADVIKAVHQVCEAADRDPAREYRREAPQEIQDIAKRAKPLPREIYEIAHKMVHGDWPDYLAVDVEPHHDFTFTAEVPESA